MSDDIKLEETRPFAMIERAKTLVVEAADLGQKSVQLFALALILAEIEKFREENNNLAAQLREKKDLLGVLLNQILDKAGYLPPGQLPPGDLMRMIAPDMIARALRDTQYASEIITLFQIAKDEK